MLFGIGERPDVLSFFCSTFSSVRSDGPSGTSRIRDKLCMGYGTNRLGRTIIAEKSPKASFFLSDYMCLCAITKKRTKTRTSSYRPLPSEIGAIPSCLTPDVSVSSYSRLPRSSSTMSPLPPSPSSDCQCPAPCLFLLLHQQQQLEAVH